MTDVKKRVLFICIHNSARSQMAAAFLKQVAGDRFDVESAGIEPGSLNPLVVRAMKEIGIDISRNATQSVFDLFKSGQRFQYVISVCDEASAERCPVFPGVTTRLNWSFADPSTFAGTEPERLRKIVAVRELASYMATFVAALPSPYREALVLTELQEMSHKDAAQMLGVSLPAMKARVRRGRQQIQQMLEACCDIAPDARGRVLSYDRRPDGTVPKNCCADDKGCKC